MTRALSRRWLCALAVLSVSLPFAAFAGSPADDPTQFVDAAMHDMAIALETPATATTPTRSEQLHAVLTHYFDIAQLGRNSVGAAWLLVAPERQAAFVVTLENFLITGYCGGIVRPGELSFGPAHVIPSAAPAEASGRIAVAIEARGSDGDTHPIRLALARRDDGEYRIVDVSAESISLGRLLAEDFGAVLHRNGGHVEALAVALQDKIAARSRDK